MHDAACSTSSWHMLMHELTTADLLCFQDLYVAQPLNAAVRWLCWCVQVPDGAGLGGGVHAVQVQGAATLGELT
jgi:hypothetical protein